MAISGSIPKGLTAMTYPALISVVKDAGKQVILDTSGELLEAALEIYRKGIDIVVLSLGADGAAMVTKEGVFRAKVPKQSTVNTVGCGDSMIAGFALGLENGDKNMEEVLRQASAISAAAALCEETGFFAVEDMRRIYPEIVIEKLENEVEKWR